MEGRWTNTKHRATSCCGAACLCPKLLPLWLRICLWEPIHRWNCLPTSPPAANEWHYHSFTCAVYIECESKLTIGIFPSENLDGGIWRIGKPGRRWIGTCLLLRRSVIAAWSALALNYQWAVLWWNQLLRRTIITMFFHCCCFGDFQHVRASLPVAPCRAAHACNFQRVGEIWGSWSSGSRRSFVHFDQLVICSGTMWDMEWKY